MWAIICLIFGPIGLMILFVLPKKAPAAGASNAKRSEQDALYEVPKKHN